MSLLKHVVLAAASAALLVVVSGCGGDDAGKAPLSAAESEAHVPGKTAPMKAPAGGTTPGNAPTSGTPAPSGR